jgi:sugar lactone lactonase YvrE
MMERLKDARSVCDKKIMKKLNIVSKVLSLVITLSVISCKKDNQWNSSGNIPSNEKRWKVTTVAGNGTALFADGPSLMAEFRAPADVAVSPDGPLYVADAINHRIREIANGQVSSLAGFDRQDTISGIGTSAGFATPIQIVADPNGTLYTLDVNDLRVRKIIIPGAVVSVVAGNGTPGFADGRADTARFGESDGIAVDMEGNIYVSDWGNKRIRKISATGQVTTVVSGLISPAGIVIDRQGNLYFGDGSCVKKITPQGVVSVFAGSNSIGYRDGQPNEALFGAIEDMVIDGQGNIYLTDDNRVRMITSQGVVSTIAGSTPGYKDGDGATAQFNGAFGLGIDPLGNIYVADSHNNRIRRISFE